MTIRKCLSWLRQNFRAKHAAAGATFYACVIAAVNLDKTTEVVITAALRQIPLMLVLTGFFVAHVEKVATRSSIWFAIKYGVLFPAVSVAIASTLAHFFFTNEVRNVLAPFATSAVLNSALVSAYRAGHETLWSQLCYVLRGFR